MQPFNSFNFHRTSDTAIEVPEHITDAGISEQPSGISEKEWPPVKLEDLPLPPPVKNIDISKGPIVRFRVFGFAVLWSELAIMAKKLGYNDGKQQMVGVCVCGMSYR